MIGLEYICELYNKKFIKLAEELGISRQVINGWVKGRRPISKKYLPTLSEMFNLPEEYFQKELNDMDKLSIQQIKIRNEIVEYEYEDTFIDEESGEEITITRTQLDENQFYENSFLEFKKDIINLHNDIDVTINSKFTNGVIDNDINLNSDLYDAEELLKLYKGFVEIIKRGKIKADIIETLFKGIKCYEGVAFTGESKILKVVELMNEIDSK